MSSSAHREVGETPAVRKGLPPVTISVAWMLDVVAQEAQASSVSATITAGFEALPAKNVADDGCQ